MSSCCSVAKSCPTLCDPWTAACQPLLSSTISRTLLKFMSIESDMVCTHLTLHHCFLLYLQTFPVSRFFLMSWFFASDALSIGASVSASVISMNIKGRFPLGLSGLISLQCKGLSRVFSNTTVQKHQFFSLLYGQLHNCTWNLEDLCWQSQQKKMSLLFNMLSRFVINFIPRSKHVLISCLQSPSAVILEPPKIVCFFFHCFSNYLPWSDGTRCHNVCFLNVEL